jgi:hypothetical protein
MRLDLMGEPLVAEALPDERDAAVSIALEAVQDSDETNSVRLGNLGEVDDRVDVAGIARLHGPGDGIVRGAGGRRRRHALTRQHPDRCLVTRRPLQRNDRRKWTDAGTDRRRGRRRRGNRRGARRAVVQRYFTVAAWLQTSRLRLDACDRSDTTPRSAPPGVVASAIRLGRVAMLGKIL